MALTPLAKNIVKGVGALAILAVTCSVGFYIYSNSGDDPATTVASAPGEAAPAQAEDRGVFSGIFGGGGNSGPLGSEGNPLTVSIVSWHGYVGGLTANGGLTTQPGSINARNGLYVKYILDDGIPTMAERFEPGDAQCMWRTVDFWAQEQPALRSVGLDGRMVMVVDNSRGGDAIIGRKGTIESVEDLAGKTVAITEFTPSHMLGLYAVEQSSLSGRAKSSVNFRGFPDNATALAAFRAGQVDALITWEPETSIALTTVDGATPVFTTAEATSLIYDGIVCNTRTIETHPDVIQRFVGGWMEGATAARANPGAGADVLTANEPLFAALVADNGRNFLTDRVFGGIVWSDLADNIRVLGLAGSGGDQIARIYSESNDIWRANTNLLDGMAQVSSGDAFDDTFIRALMDTAPQARTAAAAPEFTFTSTERATVVQTGGSALTKPIAINFATGQATLNARGKATIEAELIPLLDATAGSYVRVSGNTDSTGGAALNTRLSGQRAGVVSEWLQSEWEIPGDRLEVVGNGEDNPICDESNPTGDGYDDLETCRAANRTTRFEILSR